MGAASQDARERAAPLVVDNNSLDGPASGEEGGHGNGPRKGPLDDLASEQPSTRRRPSSRQVGVEWVRSESFETREPPGTVSGPGPAAAADTGLVVVVDERPDRDAIATSSDDNDDVVPIISVHCKRHSPQEASSAHTGGAALELRSAGGDPDARSKRSRRTLDEDDNGGDDADADQQQHRQTTPAGRSCAAHRHHRVSSCRAARVRAEPSCRRDASRCRPCRVHDRRRDCPRGKPTDRPNPEQQRHLRPPREPENAIVQLEQDPILRPVRILGYHATSAEGRQEISTAFLQQQPVGPSYVYAGVGVGQLAGGEPRCFALHNHPDNILPKSRAGSLARFLDGPNRAVRNINRKVLAMARSMTPAWSLRLLGVSCGSVVCAWGLLLILSVLGGGASHGAANFGLGGMSAGTMDDLNGVRCPWACTCAGQEVDCSYRGLTQIPGDLASLLIAEKL